VQTAPLANLAGGILAISPGGERIAYLAEEPGAGGWGVYVRDLDRLEARMVPGSEVRRDLPGSGHTPFFSPDGRWIGFRAPGSGIMRASIDGGPALKIIDDPPVWLGGAWEGGTLLFAPGGDLGLVRAPVTGVGQPEQWKASKEGFIATSPKVLPGGRAAVFMQFTAQGSRIAALNLASREERILVEQGGGPLYASTGHLVFMRAGRTLMAAPFDLDRLAVTGEPVPVIDGVRVGDYAMSANGTLVYVPADEAGMATAARLVWVNRAGQVLRAALAASLENPRNIRLSPDERRLALVTGRTDATSGGDVWIHDLGGRPPSPLVKAQNSVFNGGPVWSPDGRRVAFASGTAGDFRVYLTAADGSVAKPTLVETGVSGVFPTEWLRENELLIDDSGGGANSDVISVPADGGPVRDLIASEAYHEQGARRSPDGRWIAYVSNRSGQNEVWVRAYTGGAPVRVSPQGGAQPVWSRDSRELFYLQGNTMMATAVKPGSTFGFDAVVKLFEASFARIGGGTFEFPGGAYDVARDGRFLMIQPLAPPRPAATIVVVQNWFEELKRRVPIR
jgi:Tol biopolymer transport system component